jgi:hypothetical protein
MKVVPADNYVYLSKLLSMRLQQLYELIPLANK